jgi:uncharacterized protein YqjF (DUF2071 family)
MKPTFLTAKWEHLIMANYLVDPDLLMPYLPAGVELDYYNDQAFVSLVGFMFKNTKLFRIPIPIIGTFEEINLRFYVKRKDSNTVKRGVVFINETVPYKPVAWFANKLFKEHYIAIPTKNEFVKTNSSKSVNYRWNANNQWNNLQVNARLESVCMQAGSIEEFIFEHYYGYTKLSPLKSQEYQISHPRWLINEVINYSIFCDFKCMYGDRFSFLSDCKPHSVMIAEGSLVNVNWRRLVF